MTHWDRFRVGSFWNPFAKVRVHPLALLAFALVATRRMARGRAARTRAARRTGGRAYALRKMPAPLADILHDGTLTRAERMRLIEGLFVHDADAGGRWPVTAYA